MASYRNVDYGYLQRHHTETWTTGSYRGIIKKHELQVFTEVSCVNLATDVYGGIRYKSMDYRYLQRHPTETWTTVIYRGIIEKHGLQKLKRHPTETWITGFFRGIIQKHGLQVSDRNMNTCNYRGIIVCNAAEFKNKLIGVMVYF
jgi:hypothetical protein